MIFYLAFVIEFLGLFFLSRLLIQSLSNLFHRITRSKTATIYLLSLLFFPGVVIHELSHLITAGILLVRVGELEFIPQIKEEGVKLGSVEIAKTDPARRALIGFAPVVIGTAIMISFLSYVSTDFLTGKIIAGYIFFEIGNTMFSSRKDLEGTLELLLAVFFIFILLFLFGLRLPQSILVLLMSASIIDFVKQSSIFLLSPIGIDLVIYGLVKALRFP